MPMPQARIRTIIQARVQVRIQVRIQARIHSRIQACIQARIQARAATADFYRAVLPSGVSQHAVSLEA